MNLQQILIVIYAVITIVSIIVAILLVNKNLTENKLTLKDLYKQM